MANDQKSAAPPDSAWERFKAHAAGPMGFASIGKELQYAVTDIRQKVVEEGMYGRQVTPTVIDKDQDPLGRTQKADSASFEDRCREVAKNAPAETPGHDHGPDR